MKKIIIYILFFILLYSNRVYSQNTSEKPVVALVLSGGTAKGLSHIGVIKTLEEIGIKPDIIVGTSMGSIVGGLYSLGYSSDDLEKIALTSDWYRYLTNDTDLRKINIEQKDEFSNYLFDFILKKKKPDPGQGLVYGQEMELYLNRLTYPAYKYDNFDQFPIKYRAIAVDVLKAEKYVFKDGPLAVALRSSMSLPTIFIPKKYKNKLLVDGGVLDNFGVDVALENGADIIIGSNVGRMNLDEEQLGSFPHLFWLITMMGSKQNYDKYKDSVDVLIEAPVLDLGTRFDKAAEIMRIGYETAQKHRKELLAIKRELDKYESKPVRTVRFNKNQVYPITDIEINGLKNKNYSDQLKIFLRKKLGKRVSHQMIENEIEELYGSGEFAYITYYMDKTPGKNEYKLIFNCQQLPLNTLGIGIQYSNQVDFGIIASLTSRNYLVPNSKFNIKGRISKYPYVSQYFTKYFLDKTRFGIRQSFQYFNDRISIYEGDNKLTAYNRNFIIPGFNIFASQTKNSLVNLGYRYTLSSYKDVFSYAYDNYINGSFHKNTLYFSYYYNNIDDKNFATTGSIFKVSLEYNFSSSLVYTLIDDKNISSYHVDFSDYPDYPGFKFSLEKYISFNSKWTIENGLSAEYSGLSDVPFILKTKTMGGVFPDNEYQSAFWGLPDNYLISANKFVFKTGLRYKFEKNIYFKTLFNFGLTDNWKQHYGWGMSVVVKTPFGPITAGITKSVEYKYPLIHINIGIIQ